MCVCVSKIICKALVVEVESSGEPVDVPNQQWWWKGAHDFLLVVCSQE